MILKIIQIAEYQTQNCLSSVNFLKIVSAVFFINQVYLNKIFV